MHWLSYAPLSLTVLVACGDELTQAPVRLGKEHLTATPLPHVSTVEPGIYELSIGLGPRGFLLVPASAGTEPMPFVLMLHGAGGTPGAIENVMTSAEQYRFALAVPRSRGSTWDVALDGSFEDDVETINQVLQEAFKRVRVDPNHIAIAGFSDGASYALTLALANGNLFSHTIAFSPGFIHPVTRRGKSSIFVAHGRADGVLSPSNTRDNIVPFLRALGYSVRYYDFDGGHQLTDSEADTAFVWFVGRS